MHSLLGYFIFPAASLVGLEGGPFTSLFRFSIQIEFWIVIEAIFLGLNCRRSGWSIGDVFRTFAVAHNRTILPNLDSIRVLVATIFHVLFRSYPGTILSLFVSEQERWIVNTGGSSSWGSGGCGLCDYLGYVKHQGGKHDGCGRFHTHF